MPNPQADFTPHDVDLLLRKNSYTAVPFTFQNTDFTGYTTAEFKWIERDDTSDTALDSATLQTVAMSIAIATDSAVTVTFDTAAWSTVDTASHGLFEVWINDPSSNPICLATGLVDFEEALS